jgi:hypothetical protein
VEYWPKKVPKAEEPYDVRYPRLRVKQAADVAEEEGGGDQKKKTLDAEHHFTPVHRI